MKRRVTKSVKSAGLSRQLTEAEFKARPVDRRPKGIDSMFSSFVDGEEHALETGVDFGPADGFIVEWVPKVVQPDLVPGESPVFGAVVAFPSSRPDGKFYIVEEGWAMAATRLKALADVLDLDAEVIQRNRRNKDGELLSTDYTFMIKEEED